MNLRRYHRMVCGAAALLMGLPLYALADTEGAAFLKLGGAARPQALGDAYTAASGSVDTLFYNPGGLASLTGADVSLTHSEWLEDMNFDILSYGQRTSYGVWGLSALRLGGGSQEGRNELRQKTGSFTTEDIAGVFSYARPVGDYIGAGANVKIVHSRIDSTGATAFALDLGGIFQVPGHNLQLGASLLNVGNGLRFDDQVDRLPLVAAVGVVGRPVRPLELSLDIKRQPYKAWTEIDAGAELVLSIFAFRIGYSAPVQGSADKELGANERFRGGLGVVVGKYRADYTLVPFGDLGLTQRFTLSASFGGSDPREPKNLQSSATDTQN